MNQLQILEGNLEHFDLKQYDLNKVDLNNDKMKEWTWNRPLVLMMNSVAYRMSTWEELLQILCYVNDCPDTVRHFLGSAEGRHCKGSCIPLMSLDDKSSSIVVAGTGSVKFSAAGDLCSYVKCHHTYGEDGKSLANIAINNLKTVQALVRNLKTDGLCICLASEKAANNDKQLKELAEAAVKRMTAGSKKKTPVKSAKYWCSRINNEVLSVAEMFFSRIIQDFSKRILIGDVEMTDEEERNFLMPYLMACINKLQHGKLLDECDPRIFAIGMVRFAMRHYGSRKFWPYFEKEYGLKVAGNMQSLILDEFLSVMKMYGKAYNKEVGTSIDNINMHCFVTDKSSGQLFDFIFNYWSQDLKRNADNMTAASGKFYKPLLDKLSAYNSFPDVMKHTSVALAECRRSCLPRIRRIIKLMDSCFWDNTEIKQTGNRINKLLSAWMSAPDGKFRNEIKTLNRAKKHDWGRGATFLSQPKLAYNAANDTFVIMFPEEILRSYDECTDPVWEVSCFGKVIMQVPAKAYNGSLAVYTEETSKVLPAEYLFGNIKAVLKSPSGDSLVKYNHILPDYPVRMFDSKGNYVEHTKNILPAGTLMAVSPDCTMPEILYSTRTSQPEEHSGFYVQQYEARRGEIMVMPDRTAYAIGDKLREGLNGVYFKEVRAGSADSECCVYRELPKILFKTDRESLGGTGLTISKDGIDKTFRLGVSVCEEVKLDSSLDSVNGYVVDLGDYIEEEGVYTVCIAFPATYGTRIYTLAWLKSLSFNFTGEPYIFKEVGEISFSPDSPVRTDSSWDVTASAKKLQFYMSGSIGGANDVHTDEDRDKQAVQGRDLRVMYEIDGVNGKQGVPLYIRIPALHWRFREDMPWSAVQPADISRHDIPSRLYASGPFSFDSDCYLSVLDEYGNEIDGSDIDVHKVSGKDYYWFDFSDVKSWNNCSVHYRQVAITLDGHTYDLLRVICRSTVEDVTLSAQGNMLAGIAKIIGDEEYTVTVTKEGQVIGEDLPVGKDGSFETEVPDGDPGGNYEVTVYEMEDSDEGFSGAFAIKLGSFVRSVVTAGSLGHRTLILHSLSSRAQPSKKLQLRYDYRVTNLEKVEDADSVIDDIAGLWSVNLAEQPEKAGDLTFYKASLYHQDKSKWQFDFKVLLVFLDRNNLYDVTVLRDDDGMYAEMICYYNFRDAKDSDNGIFIRSEDDFMKNMNNPAMKKDIRLHKLICICDDNTGFDITYEE